MNIDDKLTEYKNILKLNDWEIQVNEEESLGDNAEAKMLFNYYKAIIKINNNLNDEEKEKSLIHELLHVIHRDEMDIMFQFLNDEQRIFYERFHERAIEKMAQIIYKLNCSD